MKKMITWKIESHKNRATMWPFVFGPFSLKTRRGRVTIFGAFLTVPLTLGLNHYYFDRRRALKRSRGEMEKEKER